MPAYASRARKGPGTRYDLHKPCRQTCAGLPSALLCNLPSQTSLQLGHPTSVPRSSIGMDHLVQILHHCCYPVSKPMPATHPSAHSTCIRLGICLSFNACATHSIASGTCKSPRRETDRGHLLLISLLRTPTESLHCLTTSCAPRVVVISHPRTSRARTTRHIFAGLYFTCHCRRAAELTDHTRDRSRGEGIVVQVIITIAGIRACAACAPATAGGCSVEVCREGS